MAKWSELHNGKFPDPYAKLKFDEEKKEKKKKKKKKQQNQIDANGNKVGTLIIKLKRPSGNPDPLTNTSLLSLESIFIKCTGVN